VVGALSYAGIPITDRRHSASFAVVTGHKDPTRVSADTRWNELATAADTLVILMGMRNLGALVERIVEGGRAPGTPAAAVIEGTLPSQRVVEAPLSELPRRVAEAGLGAPAVVVVGDVVELRKKLAWYERRPLFGKRVLVTRAEDQAGEMVAALRAAGAEAILAPMIRIAPPESWDEADAALDRLESYDVVLVTSANAIRRLAGRARELGIGFGGLRARVLCVGPKTAEATLAEGLPVHALPGERYDAEGLLELIGREHAPAGRRFLFPRAERARAVLVKGLRGAGAIVDPVAVYRTLPPEQQEAGLRERLAAGEIDVLTFTSPSTVRNFLSQLAPEARCAAERALLAAIGPVTAEALRKEGLEPDVVPDRALAAELVAALTRAIAGRAGGES
jgi:uroporphyrinogen III methyltransferase/synthase